MSTRRAIVIATLTVARTTRTSQVNTRKAMTIAARKRMISMKRDGADGRFHYRLSASLGDLQERISRFFERGRGIAALLIKNSGFYFIFNP